MNYLESDRACKLGGPWDEMEINGGGGISCFVKMKSLLEVLCLAVFVHKGFLVLKQFLTQPVHR